MLAFDAKIKAMTWNVQGEARTKFDMLKYTVTYFCDEIMSNIQAINGMIEGASISKLELPVNDNILSILNEIKICVNNWFELHQDNIEYTGARFIVSKFLAEIHKFIYEFRLLKISDKNYAEMSGMPNPDAPISF